MLKALFIFLLSFSFMQSDEFSDGPYGINYFDIAAPFTVKDLNTSLSGDVNEDDILNIQDIIMLVGAILENITLNDYEFNQADLNNDSILDILDIVEMVNSVLNPQNSGWSFESNWTGEESFIFIHYQTSSTLWFSSDFNKEWLLERSPMNVHYFFLSAKETFESDVLQVKEQFDTILSTLPSELQDHWNSHLHFIPENSLELGNWLSDALNGKSVLAIDQFQQLREIGYLGNPASFTGNYIYYLAHEAIYFDYEWRQFRDNGDVYDEVTIFDEEIYTGGWAASISKTVQLPSASQMQSYNKLEVELLRGCPDSNGNYSDAGCDDYDRIAHLYVCDSEGANCLEISRWITPFDRQPHSLTDITPFLATLKDGGPITFKFQESGWPNSLLTLKLRLHSVLNSQDATPKEIIPMWLGTTQFNPDYNENRPLQVFDIPENAVKVEFVSFITGHGWGCSGCFNCAEFCNSKHMFSVNGGVHYFDKSHPNASSSTYCMSLDAIAEGVIPNQYGTWGYGRAGWCPGQDVKPFIVDITEHVIAGDENILEYEACRMSGTSCLTAPVCPGDGCYCPEIAMSSYIIISY